MCAKPALHIRRVTLHAKRGGRGFALDVTRPVQVEAAFQTPSHEPLRQCPRPRPDGGGADLVDDLESRAGDVRIDDGRCSAIEAPSGRRPVQAGRVERERLGAAEPAGHRGTQRLGELASDVEECDPGRPHEVLETPARERVHSEHFHVDRLGAERLVRIDEHECPVGMSRAGDRGDVLLPSIHEVGVRRRHDGRSIGDARVIRGRVYRPVGGKRNPFDFGASRLLCKPDVPHGRELCSARYHASPPSVKRECAREGTHGVGDGAHDRHLVHLGVDQPGEGAAATFDLADPGVPIHAVAPPGLEVRVGRPAGVVGCWRLRAVVHRHRMREERDSRAPELQVVRG